LVAFATFLDTILRAAVLAAAMAAGVVAVTHWAVRRQHLTPFSAWARGVRRLSDPLLKPVERSLVRFGRPPQEASLWLLGIVMVGGILLISVVRWVEGLLLTLAGLQGASPRTWLRFGLDFVLNLLMLALVVRVISSWFGVSPFRRWMRPAFRATDWLVQPIRQRLPAFGPIDFSPLVAYLVLVLLRVLVLSVV
jgi:YggT family protein